mmetsp:Transcript_44292/g.125309  ORF Transcript_44292/g.125309 Transcript_44292/m.125309 type:complete len:207 (-) Transcript_44292:1020-1640(-)
MCLSTLSWCSVSTGGSSAPSPSVCLVFSRSLSRSRSTCALSRHHHSMSMTHALSLVARLRTATLSGLAIRCSCTQSDTWGASHSTAGGIGVRLLCVRKVGCHSASKPTHEGSRRAVCVSESLKGAIWSASWKPLACLSLCRVPVLVKLARGNPSLRSARRSALIWRSFWKLSTTTTASSVRPRCPSVRNSSSPLCSCNSIGSCRWS